MNRVRLLTAWGSKGKAGHFPQVLLDHPPVAGESYQDMTGQPGTNLPPSPNVYTVELVCTDATLSGLQADSNYAPGILWSEPT